MTKQRRGDGRCPCHTGKVEHASPGCLRRAKACNAINGKGEGDVAGSARHGQR